jgi:hypothetical protein
MEKRINRLLGELVAINSVNPTLSGGPGEREIAGASAWMPSFIRWPSPGPAWPPWCAVKPTGSRSF